MPHSINLDECCKAYAFNTLACNGAARLRLLTFAGVQRATQRSYSTLVRRWPRIIANSL